MKDIKITAMKLGYKETTILTVIFGTLVLALLSVPEEIFSSSLDRIEKIPMVKVLLTAFALEFARAALLILSTGLAQNGREKEYWGFMIISLGLTIAIGFYLNWLLWDVGTNVTLKDNSTALGAQIANASIFLLDIFLGRLVLTGDGGIIKMREEIDKHIEDYNGLAERKDKMEKAFETTRKELEGVKLELDEVRPKLESVKNVLEKNRILIEDNKSSIGGYAPLVCEHDGTIIQVFSNNTPKATCPTCSRTVVKKSKIVSLSKAANS